MMKYLVVVVFSAAILVSVCNAACASTKPDPYLNGCFYKGKLYDLNSKWRTKNCMDCSCGSDGELSCCYATTRPVNYDAEKCNFIFNKKTCSFELIPNKDPTKQCESYGMVG